MAKMKEGKHGPVYKNLDEPDDYCPRVLVLDGDLIGATGRVFSESQIKGPKEGTYLAVRIPAEIRGFSYIRHYREEQIRYV